MLKVKFESDVNVFIEGIADCENVDTAAIQETLDMQPEELVEGEDININGKRVCDE